MLFSLTNAECIFQFVQYSTAIRYNPAKLYPLQTFASTYIANSTLAMFAVQNIPIF